MKKVIRLTESDLVRIVKRTITEMESGSQLEDLDNWIENNSDYISEYSLKEMLIELFDLNEDNVEIDEYIENDRGGDMYGENWSKKLLTIKNNGEDLFKIWLKMDNIYDYGKNSNELYAKPYSSGYLPKFCNKYFRCSSVILNLKFELLFGKIKPVKVL